MTSGRIVGADNVIDGGGSQIAGGDVEFQRIGLIIEVTIVGQVGYLWGWVYIHYSLPAHGADTAVAIGDGGEGVSGSLLQLCINTEQVLGRIYRVVAPTSLNRMPAQQRSRLDVISSSLL